jgi:hypothetical protein
MWRRRGLGDGAARRGRRDTWLCGDAIDDTVKPPHSLAATLPRSNRSPACSEGAINVGVELTWKNHAVSTRNCRAATHPPQGMTFGRFWEQPRAISDRVLVNGVVWFCPQHRRRTRRCDDGSVGPRRLAGRVRTVAAAAAGAALKRRSGTEPTLSDCTDEPRWKSRSRPSSPYLQGLALSHVTYPDISPTFIGAPSLRAT